VSGICGIVNFDGAPVDPELLKKMAEAAAYRGPDGINYWIEGNVGLAHLALHTTPESLRETQPLLNARKDAILVADARVDNRDELIRTLTAKGHLQEKDPTDADLILAAYECWGEECPKQIIGDFAFAVWDTRQRKLFCARDPVGVRLLHYCQIDHTFIIATNIGALLATLSSSPSINRALIQDFLAGQYGRWVHETAYQTIFRVPQSYHLVATDNVPSLTRYWTWGAQPSARYKNDSEYIDHFRELLQQAVRARLRTVSPLAILMSGGLDSTSVTCLVDHLIASESLDVSAHSYSCVFDHTPSADEREYIEAVIEKCSHLKSTLMACDDCWGLKEFGNDGDYPLDEPDISVDRALHLRLLNRPRQDHGCRVILWGEGADNILVCGGPYHIPQVLRDVRLADLPAELAHFCYYSQRPSWWLLMYAYLRPIVPEQIWKRLSRWRHSARRTTICQPNKTIPHNFLPPPRLKSQSALASYRNLTKPRYAARLVLFDSIAAYSEVEQRFPFLDRRLVDYAIALPPRLHFRNGFRKYILRESMVGILPERVRQRTSVSHVSELILRGLYEKERSRVHELLQSVQVVRAGFMDREHLSTMLTSYRQIASSSMNPLVQSWMRVLCLEAWLQCREQRSVGKTARSQIEPTRQKR